MVRRWRFRWSSSHGLPHSSPTNGFVRRAQATPPVDFAVGTRHFGRRHWHVRKQSRSTTQYDGTFLYYYYITTTTTRSSLSITTLLSSRPASGILTDNRIQQPYYTNHGIPACNACHACNACLHAWKRSVCDRVSETTSLLQDGTKLNKRQSSKSSSTLYLL